MNIDDCLLIVCICLLTISIALMSGCSTNKEIVATTVTEYPDIPAVLQELPNPPVLQGNTISDVIRYANECFLDYNILQERYKSLLYLTTE